MWCDWYLWATEWTKFPIQLVNAANQCLAVVCNGSAAFGGSILWKTTLLELHCLYFLSILGNMCISTHTHTCMHARTHTHPHTRATEVVVLACKKEWKTSPLRWSKLSLFCRVKIVRIDATAVVDESGLKMDICMLVHRLWEHMCIYDLINLYLLQNMIMLLIC